MKKFHSKILDNFFLKFLLKILIQKIPLKLSLILSGKAHEKKKHFPKPWNVPFCQIPWVK